MDETRLGTLLLESRLIAEPDLEKCLEIQALTGGTWPLGQIVVEQGLITRANLEQLLELQKTRVQQRRTLAVGEGSDHYLQTAFDAGANELVISEGRPVLARVAGEWIALSTDPMNGPQVWDFVRDEMGGEVLEELADTQFVSRELHKPGRCRGRITAFRQFDGVAVTVRLHPELPRTTKELGVPDAIVDLVRQGKGLILLASERGSGRTEMLASLLQVAAEDAARFVLVLDDSLEYPLPEGPALLARRRVGAQVSDYGTALRTAVREDPDTIFIGDVGEPETFDLAIRAAEAGRLVVGCLHAGSVVATLHRALNFYPSYDIARVRATLASVLRGLLSMHLLPEAGRNSMVAATEMLLIDDAAREVVRSGDLGHLSLLMRMDGATSTGHSLDRSLLDLLAAGRVRFADVFARAEEKSMVLDRSRQLAARVGAGRPQASS